MTSIGRRRFGNRAAVEAALLLILPLIVYWPSYRAGFIWDDDVMAANPFVKGGWGGLRDLWFSAKFIDYVPLTSTSFWLEWQCSGAAQTTQHAVNIILHAFNALLVWRLLDCLRIRGAWVAALIFAVHPVCVASVTWVAERKNTLSMFFYLLSLLCYLRFDDTNNSKFKIQNSKLYLLSLLAFLLALLSKPSVVILPVVLLLCAWWRRGCLRQQDFRRTAPFFLAALASGLMAVWIDYVRAPRFGFAPVSDSLLVRALAGTRAIWFYVGKDFLPLNLALPYPQWEINPGSVLAYLPSLALVGCFILFWRWRRGWGRPCLFGFGYFILALAPALGLLKMTFLRVSQVADHLQYLALPGLIALIVAAAVSLLQHTTLRNGRSPLIRCLAPGLSVAVMILLSILTWRHELVIGDPVALWQTAIRRNPNSWLAHNNLGKFFAEHGRYAEAEAESRLAASVNPQSPEGFFNLGNALLFQGKWDEAIAAYSQALRLDPNDSQACNNLAQALLNKGETDAALRNFQTAVRLNPENAEAQYNLGQLLARLGSPQESVECYVRALRIDPNLAEAHFALGVASYQQRRIGEALAHWRRAHKLKPDSAEILNNLAWLLATGPEPDLRNGVEAVRLAERACALHGTDASSLDTLAAAYAEVGRFNDATNAAAKAVSLAESRGQTNALPGFRSRHELYRHQHAYHQ